MARTLYRWYAGTHFGTHDRQRQPVYVGQEPVIGVVQPLPLDPEPFQLGELSQRDSGMNIRQVVFVVGEQNLPVPEAIRPIPLPRVPAHPVQAQELDPLRQFFAPRNRHSPLAGRDVFRGVQTEHGRVGSRALGSASVFGLDGVGRVLDEEKAVASGQRFQAVHLARVAVQMDGHDGLGARIDPRRHGGGVQVERIGLDVSEDGGGSDVHQDVGRRDEAQRRGNHLVARTHPQTDQRQMEGRDARIDRQHVRGAQQVAELGFQPVRPRSHGYPARAEGRHDLRLLLRSEAGAVKRQKFGAGGRPAANREHLGVIHQHCFHFPCLVTMDMQSNSGSLRAIPWARNDSQGVVEEAF